VIVIGPSGILKMGTHGKGTDFFKPLGMVKEAEILP
jgi:hypothetical protein